MFFDENGILNIDEVVVNQDSFKKIMEDGVVTEQEIKQHADKVVSMLQGIEQSCSAEQATQVKELLAEACVLFAAHHVYSIQNINK